MYCPGCGKQITVNDHYCPYCGKQLNSDQQPSYTVTEPQQQAILTIIIGRIIAM